MTTKEKFFRKNLSRAFKMGMVNEGLFDDIINFLGGLETKWTDSLSSTQGAALQNIPDDLEPTESAQDQLHAVVCVCQAVGYSIEGIMQRSELIAARIEEINTSSTDDPEGLFGQAQSILSDAIKMAGEASGWLQNDNLRKCSNKIAGVGDDINVGIKAADSIKSLSEALSEINNLNIDGEIEKVIKSEAAKNLLENDPYWSERGKTFVEEGLSLIKQIPNAIIMLDEVGLQVESLEKLLDQKSEEPEVVATASVQASSVFETTLSNIYKRILSEIDHGC